MKRGHTAAVGLIAMSWLLASAGALARPVAGVPGAPHVVPTRVDMLKYYGGRVISNVEIVEVFWGPNVDPTVTAQIGAFYTALVKSSYVDWLSEYDTIGKTGFVDNLPGSNQHIGRGTYAGAKTITPTNMAASVTDAEVAAELVAQIGAGHLPPPSLDAGGNVNTLYMIDFPPGVDITLLGMTSCSGFGAYHFTVTMNGKSVPYGVHPDCAYSFDRRTLVHSHELIEAMTDTEVGLPSQTAPTDRPIAWATVAMNTFDSQEIGDICQGAGSGVVFAGFTVQKEWSNYAGACVIGVPICDGVMQPPACRPCNAFDSGNACEGAAPACATQGPKVGRCVVCTADHATACTGATPACDDKTNTCVGCVKSTDCKAAATPVCETSTETCRACKADAECATGSVCDTSSDAMKGQCVACIVDAQCPGQRCDPRAHKCIPLPPPDAGVDMGDAGTAAADSGASANGSCGCTTVGAPSGSAASLVLAGVLGAIGARRRRSRSR